MSAGDTGTVGYIPRRTAEGKSGREIIRCLKRFVAREVFKIIRNALPVDSGTGRLRQRRRTLATPVIAVATDVWRSANATTLISPPPTGGGSPTASSSPATILADTA
ncbi:hypothetical protein [Rhodococcus sp. USK13]|uniref:hypothetical protein n=1 Tax=Rhodococcus sp. USK13 TaxID=2806442 RepID=UPI001BCE4C91|nr:hypothetical protein [Rhodococcus sp. USK13]